MQPGDHERMVRSGAAEVVGPHLLHVGRVSDEQGLENCVKGLKRLMSTAEKYKVTLSMELLNSKVNHKDYMCDHSKWGVELVKRVGSPNFKLLFITCK